MRIETLAVGGSNVHWSRREGADLVVLVRLAGRGGGVWDAIWPHLAEACAVASVDLALPPDAGESDAAIFRSFSVSICEVADALGHERVHLIGWNGGAHVALDAAVHAPERLRSLTLMTPFREAGDRRQIDIGLDLLEALLRSGRRDLYAWHWFMAGFSDRFLQTRFDEVERLVAQRLAADSFLSLDVDRAMRWMRALRRDHLSDDALRAIGVPTLILAAGMNRWHAGPTPAMAEALHRLIPHSELAVFEDCGAFFPIERPADTADRILSFIRRLPAA